MKELFFELGTEEIPARFLRRAERELGKRVVDGLNALGLETGEVRTWATPRRLALKVLAAESQPSKTETVTGPPARVAFDGDGNPTKAAVGFAKRNGVELDALETLSTPKGDYLAATVHTVGQPTVALLPAVLQEALTKLHWPKPMRWGASRATFIRPVHWMVAQYDRIAFDVTFCDITSGVLSRGHRFMAPDEFEVAGADDWEHRIRQAHVEPDADVRAASILQEARRLAAEAGGELVWDKGLLEEVSGLVESATPLLATFDPSYLEIPNEVLITSMKVHQKYFAVRQLPVEGQAPGTGALMNHFVLVAGTVTTDPAIVAHGNQRVLAARLADARFFFENDKKSTLDSFAEKLAQRTYLKGLGTMLDKAKRLESVAPNLAKSLGYDSTTQGYAATAGRLAKADLSTGMVGEFASLQGVMGWHYANHEGLPEPVGIALKQHYWPKFAGDSVPTRPVAAAVALADKLDAIVGCFCLGLEPTGSADPYALRRQALGVLRIAQQLPSGTPNHASLVAWLDATHAAYAGVVDVDWPQVRERILGFLRARLKVALSGDFPTDLVEAVLASGFDDPADAHGRLAGLAKVKATDGWQDLADAFKRVVRIVADQAPGPLDASTLQEPQAVALAQAHAEYGGAITGGLDHRDYDAALTAMVALKPSIDRFFDDVMVMSEVPAERQRRLALLAEIAGVFRRVCDFDKVST